MARVLLSFLVALPPLLWLLARWPFLGICLAIGLAMMAAGIRLSGRRRSLLEYYSAPGAER